MKKFYKKNEDLRSKIVLFLFVCLLSCKSEIKEPKTTNEDIEIFNDKTPIESSNKSVQYDLENVKDVFILEKELQEISGLGYDNQSHQIIVNNDEQGSIFYLSIADGKIVGRINFENKGDYEGIESVGNKIYMIKSNGDLSIYDTESEETTSFKTALSSTNDVEGLGYDNGKLLIACKGNPNIIGRKQSKTSKSIYRFDLNTMELEEEVFLSIEDDALVFWFKASVDASRFSKKKYKSFINRMKNFSPSGIAKNPLDNHYYLISSVGKTMVVVNASSEIKHVYFIDEKTFTQPEGICFDLKGKIYIANEGRGFAAKIFTFEPQSH